MIKEGNPSQNSVPLTSVCSKVNIDEAARRKAEAKVRSTDLLDRPLEVESDGVPRETVSQQASFAWHLWPEMKSPACGPASGCSGSFGSVPRRLDDRRAFGSQGFRRSFSISVQPVLFMGAFRSAHSRLGAIRGQWILRHAKSGRPAKPQPAHYAGSAKIPQQLAVRLQTPRDRAG
jgi:hypothetical protein